MLVATDGKLGTLTVHDTEGTHLGDFITSVDLEIASSLDESGVGWHGAGVGM